MSADDQPRTPSHTPPLAPTSEAGDLGGMLEPLLLAACVDPAGNQRLGPVEWFRSSWQRGGASTGFATWRLDDGGTIDVMVKFPVGPREHRWTTLLGAHDVQARDTRPITLTYGPTPRVFAAGTELGGHDLAWLVIERLRGGTVAEHLDRHAVEDLLLAAAEWYVRSQAAVSLSESIAADLWGKSKSEDWPALIAKARDVAKHDALPEGQRWNHALKAVEKHLSWLAPCWESRAINAWCHGDLHPGNAMRRSPSPPRQPGVPGATPPEPHPPKRLAPTDAAPCVLIDLALVHPGHWVEDAVYLERLYWARPELLDGAKPVSLLAKARRARGLATDDDYTKLANVRRVLMGATAPAFASAEGHPKYLHAALEVVERVLPLLAR